MSKYNQSFIERSMSSIEKNNYFNATSDNLYLVSRDEQYSTSNTQKYNTKESSSSQALTRELQNRLGDSQLEGYYLMAQKKSK
ncbi:ORF MSV054 hypothetical protein [Melanoplus sanguinipes entomopoxvirus]|uniref:Uncharacterized protein n=1 Tax=Melanoplus sanguinipes entomopoxvirus TaxID=83191 RepID=Q9YW38_MSEPV|nr:ORF MSV054 hypothetical protein [Melanoplus sanguinipes entomopoxvirus]AAC97823.1 ORF MSV054 hypothetical protein [Melanoplus sanguinipes entomopoxvirus 'O']